MMGWLPWRLAKRLRLVILASRRMRQRYRKRMVAMERGWRARCERNRKAAHADAEKMAEMLAVLLRRAMTIRIGRIAQGDIVGVTVHWPQEWLREMYQPQDHECLIELMSRHLALSLERELKTTNWARVNELRIVNVQERLVPAPPVRWNSGPIDPQ